MKQTQKYKLNLIEPSDSFLPDGLNQNTQKVEDVLAAANAKYDAMENTLNSAVKNLGSGGKNLRFVWGSYTGSGAFGPDYPTSLDFGNFYPLMIIVSSADLGSHIHTIMLRGLNWAQVLAGNFVNVSWNGCSVNWRVNTYNTTANSQNNFKDVVYNYFAIGCDPSDA